MKNNGATGVCITDATTMPASQFLCSHQKLLLSMLGTCIDTLFEESKQGTIRNEHKLCRGKMYKTCIKLNHISVDKDMGYTCGATLSTLKTFRS